MCEEKLEVAATAEGARPLIGVTPRWTPEDDGVLGESLNKLQFDAIIAAGGMPVMLPITKDRELISAYVDLCDGFNLPGGHNVDSTRWGEPPISEEKLARERDALEFPLVEMVLAADKPLFAICRGEQLLNVACGGTLTQDVYQAPTRPGMCHWQHLSDLNRPAHEVEVVAGTLLSRCVGGARTLQVNSAHEQCAGKLGRGISVGAYATDGIVEAIELAQKRFVLGVQWHPEYSWHHNKRDFMLWRAFVSAARTYKEERKQQ